jgi:CHAD domain-containing protein
MAKAKIRGLDCAASADAMIRLVLRAQVNALCKQREKAIAWKDPEGVHDMRVLSRRLRSSINDFKTYFRKGSLPRPALRSIADNLGTVRDIDVALIALHELKSEARGDAAEGIKLLMAEWKRQRRAARVKLKAAIGPAKTTEFRKQFLAKLQTITISLPAASHSDQTPPVTSFRDLGVRVINARVNDFMTASPNLYRPYDIKKLHELRILAKRLRYSMELFAPCLGKELAADAKEVAHMQTSLGELHDCDVWIRNLGARLKRLSRKTTPEPNAEKLKAGATWLLKHFATERMQHYADAVSRLEQWETIGFFEQIKSLLVVETPAPAVEAASA